MEKVHIGHFIWGILMFWFVSEKARYGNQPLNGITPTPPVSLCRSPGLCMSLERPKGPPEFPLNVKLKGSPKELTAVLSSFLFAHSHPAWVSLAN